MPLYNPVGFGGIDFIELAIAALLCGLAYVRGGWLAQRKIPCALALALLPLLLRLVLLPRFPVPVPNLYDEFGHLLTADTLRHFRFANPPHAMSRFFETFFVIHAPSYSSIYPPGNGLMLAIFPHPWIGVLVTMSAFCSFCYWMLRAWVTPGWALVGGLLAAMQFGPLNQWTNSYWGGGVAACAGCLVFGALPRGKHVLLGAGLGLHLLTRPYESVFLFAAVEAYLLLFRPAKFPWRAAPLILLALGITALQNRQVTGSWVTLPYRLSQMQYGVPAALTFQADPVPQRALTREQELDYRMQSQFQHGPETVSAFFSRLWFRTRYYRFYFLPPLYLALIAFLWTMRSRETFWIAGTCALFALGANFFPAFQYHYLAGIVCLFVLIAVQGLQRLPVEAARVIVFLCAVQFVLLFALSSPDARAQRRIDVRDRIANLPGKLLVFVRYWPNHIFQDEWVYNAAAIDEQRVVMARDLGDTENLKLANYYKDRQLLLLEPDAPAPRLTKWAPSPKGEGSPVAPATKDRPLLELEQVR